MNKVLIIAEAGVNHNGDSAIAKQLIDVAVEAGVDIIKFQTWKTELLVTPDAAMAEYQQINTQKTESQFSMLKKLELSYPEFIELKRYCDHKKIEFMSTPDEETSATFLNDLQDKFKIGSGELTNTPFLRHIASFGKPVILSTGMGTLAEIEHALDTLLAAGLSLSEITILHASTQYPTPMSDVNLRAMLSIAHAFPGVNIGYSDHTLGIEVPIAAVAMGACIIEKHITLDKTMPGPDHQASLAPDELKAMVTAIRHIELAMGHGRKIPTKAEQKNRSFVRKSLVARHDIQKNEVITADKISIKRPGTGISPMRWDEVVGSIAKKNYLKDELL